MNIDFYTLKAYFLSCLDSLKDFQFLASNALFWIFFVVLFFILIRFWEPKKAFSFCLVIALVLIAATQLETVIGNKFTGAGEEFDPLLIRVLSFFTVLIVVFYYTLIRE